MASQKMAPEDLIRAVQRRAEKQFSQVESQLQKALEANSLGARLKVGGNGYRLSSNLYSAPGYKEAKAELTQQYADELMKELLDKLDIVRQLGIEIEQQKMEGERNVLGMKRTFTNLNELVNLYPATYEQIVDAAADAKPDGEQQDHISVVFDATHEAHFTFLQVKNATELWGFEGITGVTFEKEPYESK